MQNSFEMNTIKEDDDGDHLNSGIKVLSRTTIINVDPGNTNTNPSLKIDHSKDKELINSGLYKLLSSLNTGRKVPRKSSKTANVKKGESNNKVQPPAVISEHDKHDRKLSSHIALIKDVSSDYPQCAESERKLDLKSSVVNEQPYRDLQCTDQRLPKKKSIPHKPHKKSLTIPHVNKSEYGSEVTENHSDDESELYFENKPFLFKCLYNYCMGFSTILGYLSGMILVALVASKVLDDDIHFGPFPQTQDVSWWYTIQHLNLNTIIEKIVRMLTISTSEFFGQEEHNEGLWYYINMWYYNY